MYRHFVDPKTHSAQLNKKQQAYQDVCKNCIVFLKQSPTIKPSKL